MIMQRFVGGAALDDHAHDRGNWQLLPDLADGRPAPDQNTGLVSDGVGRSLAQTARPPTRSEGEGGQLRRLGQDAHQPHQGSRHGEFSLARASWVIAGHVGRAEAGSVRRPSSFAVTGTGRLARRRPVGTPRRVLLGKAPGGAGPSQPILKVSS